MTAVEADGGLRDTGEIRLTDLMHAELTKIRTLPATWIVLAVTLVANTALGFLAATDVVRVAGQGGPVAIAQLGTLLLAPVYAFIAVPVFAAGSEYGGGQLRVSLTAVPNRHRFFLAKLLASSGVAVLAAVPAVLPGHLVQHVAAPRGDSGVGSVISGFLALVMAYLLVGLVGFGFAVLAKTVVTPLAVLFILPVLVSPMLGGILPGVVRLLPHEATLSFLAMPTSPALALGGATGLAVVTAWAVVFVGTAWWVNARRDTSGS
ncbi:ABC-2 type transport system permease protein [Sinosporangium album]|uniref:ABC-2 type transport system permease protein n=1 Tax=Sinosporangium album TaxID=504805 RepID=A0A1G8K306_9ACTN|nr:hypothetical protein [Sinosporangium album]SDI37769.1 ABC-2 type transport system permease protein [Sinosporangium album]